MTVTLLGVVHGKPGRNLSAGGLMNAECEENFLKRFLPRITDESVIVAEGAYVKGVVKPNHRHYKTLLSDISEGLGESDKKPRLIYWDAIGRLPDKKVDLYLTRVKQFSRFCNVGVSIDRVPTTIDEMLSLLDKPELTLRLPLLPEVIDAARQISKQVGKQNTSFATALKRAEGISDSVFFVGGASHAIAIHKEYGWAFEPLLSVKEQKIIEELYKGCLFLGALPTRISRVTSV